MCLGDYRQLARNLKASPMFTEVLPLIVKPDEVELLLKLSEKEQTADELSKLLNLPREKVELSINSLFVKDFLTKKRDGDTRYSVKSFRSIVSRYLSEGKKDSLGEYVAALANYRMEEHVKDAKADIYPESKVLPIPQTIIEPVSVILPYETAIDILEKARSISIRDCECRMAYANCDKPIRTCIALNDLSDEFVERGVAEEISLEETKKILQIANEYGLVHQVIFADWLKGEVKELCSCCPCCCTYLRAYINYGVKHHIAKSGLTAEVERDKCSGCGICVGRCVFKARKLEDGKSVVVKENCFGCGLCTTTCPTGASRLVSRD